MAIFIIVSVIMGIYSYFLTLIIQKQKFEYFELFLAVFAYVLGTGLTRGALISQAY